MYTFELSVAKTSSALVLLKEGIVLAQETWPEERDMGRQAYTALEKIVIRTGISPRAVTDFRVVSTLSDSSTSRRIAETLMKVYTFGVRTSGSV